MISEKLYKECIECGIHASSGDNSQPWKFVVKGNGIFIYNLPDRDLPFYNFLQKGSYVAHGGLIENIIIAASSKGYRAIPELFPEGENSDLVAFIRFEEAEKNGDPLFLYIPKRAVNRKPYRDIPLTENERQQIIAAGRKFEGKVLFAERNREKKILACASSKNEIIALEDKSLHRDFFEHIVWSEEEERAKKSGLYLKTLELPPPMQVIFRLLKYWPVVRILNLFGFSRIAAFGNARIYSAAAAIGVIVMRDNSRESYIMAGRTLQRIWLTAEKLGLSLQPVTGLLFLAQRVFAGEGIALNDRHVNLIKNSYRAIESVFNTEGETICLLFRIGHGGVPSARSSRMVPSISFVKS